jgi:CRP-like cAMP-binding protein
MRPMPDGTLASNIRTPSREGTQPVAGAYGPITVRAPDARTHGVPVDGAVLAMLRRQTLFLDMEAAHVERLLWSSRVATFGPGERIYERGQPARHFFVVVEGRVNLTLCSKTGDVKVLEILRPGQVLGEAAMFMQGGHYPVTAVAATAVRVARIANRDYLAVLRECPETCLRLIGHLTQRLDRHIHQIEYMTLESATHRLARVLQSRLPVDAPDPAEIELAESRQELASFLTMKPETLSRALRSLSASGVIEVRGRMLRVLDRAALQRHAEAAS